MSDSTLSQEELDAILQGSSMESKSNDTLSNAEEITFSKLANEIGTKTSNIFAQLTNKNITLDQVNILSGTNAKLTEDLSGSLIGSTSSLIGSINGEWYLFAPESTALKITNAMLNAENSEISDNVRSAFGEVISNCLSSDVTILSNSLKANISPQSSEPKIYNNGLELLDQAGIFVRIALHFLIDGASFPFYIVTPIRIVKNIVKILTTGTMSNPQQQSVNSSGGVQTSTIDMQPVQFQKFGPTSNIEPLDNLALLLDVPMHVTVELGRTRITIKDILNLGEGSIIELEKLAGEPVDVLVNDKLIALGEVVVIDENFSVRITKIITPMERIFDRENLHGKGGV